MVEEIATVMNRAGLHARPASLFVKTAAKFKSSIIIKWKEKNANAKSIIAILSMGISKGTKITIQAEGEDENQAVRTLVDLINKAAEEETS